MFIGGGVGCCLANISLIAILSVDDPLKTLANPYDSKDLTNANEMMREEAMKMKSFIIRQFLIK